MTDSTPPPASPSPRVPRKRAPLVILALLALLTIAATASYRYITAGGLRARQSPSALETYVAQNLVNLSIPAGMKSRKNPLSAHAGSTDVAAGRVAYQKNCETCHGFDGGGMTSAGGGVYPPPLSLSRDSLVKRKRTDGELFYFIRNGIRNTAMPGWQMPDQEIWQLVAYIRNLPLTAAADAKGPKLLSFALPAQYVGSVSCQKWWAPLYPPDNFQRPTGALCDGCHSVNYDIKTKTVSEWNVGCEKCHGPGSEHVRNPVASTILSPARMDYVAANDSCIQCHSQGRTLQDPIEGKHYDWPVGYDVMKPLSDYWKLEEHKLGETTFAHFADGTAHKNRMQGNDYVTSQMYAHGVTCFTCHDAHGTAHPAQLRKAADSLCLDCHGPNSASGPRTATLEEHTHHKAGSTGSSCIACHMPAIAQTLGDVNVRSHTFRFVGPAKTDASKIPNACNVCHTDKTTAWTAEALKTWSDRSPWRMAE